MIEKLLVYLESSFVIYALIVGVLIALCSSLLGVTLVLKRFSYIGDGLSHVAFGAMTVAAVLNFSNDLPLTLVVTIISAILLLRTGQNSKIKGDAIVAMVSVGSLAIGYLLMNLFSDSTNLAGDVCGTLFGSTSILTLSQTDVWICIALAIVVIVFFLFFYTKIFAVTFDETFAKATGTKTNLYNLFIAVITAIIIVLAVNLVGSLLITALIIFPTLSAMRVCDSFKGVTIVSAIISVLCAVIGVLISILWGTPVGSTIVTTDIIVFGIFFILGQIKGNRK